MSKLLSEMRALVEYPETALEKKSIHSELAVMAQTLGFDLSDDAKAAEFFQLVKMATTTQRPRVRAMYQKLTGSKSKERAVLKQIKKGVAGQPILPGESDEPGEE